jgi:hypothetical protein
MRKEQQGVETSEAHKRAVRTKGVVDGHDDERVLVAGLLSHNPLLVVDGVAAHAVMLMKK